MRVDFVITELRVGGAERCLTELALGMASRGDQVRVFSLAPLPHGQQQCLVKRLRLGGIPIATGDADSPSQFHRAYRRLRRWYGESGAEISQSFLYHANVLTALAAKASGISVRVGGLRVAEARPIRLWIERFALQRMQSVVCVSQAVERFAANRLGCVHTTVIPNGVDVARFESAVPTNWSDMGWPPDSVVSLFVGRLHPQKGIELIQQQIDAIAPPGSNRRLLLVGDGPLRSSLRAWVGRIGDQRVKLLPWQSDIAPLMRACRVLLLPSHYEGMPNVVLEAMASARPVVCSRVEGSEELLRHAGSQQSFAAGDSGAMKRLVEAFLSDETLSDRIGSANQSRVRDEFSITTMVEAYRRHYRLLLDRSS